MKEIEIEGKTVTIAVENGLKELGLARNEVEVRVIEEGTAGFLGIGAKAAKVFIRQKHWGDAPAVDAPAAKKKTESRSPVRGARRPPGKDSAPPVGRKTGSSRPAPAKAAVERPAPKPQPRRPAREAAHSPEEREASAAAAKIVISEILDLAGISDAKVSAAWDLEQSRVKAEIETADGGLVIGKGGRTIEALQFLVTVIVGRKTGKPTAIQVETQDYWKRIEGEIIEDAVAAAAEVKKTGEKFSFEPMEASLRRLIHRKLVDHPDVETASEGEGPWRKVVVRPRRK